MNTITTPAPARLRDLLPTPPPTSRLKHLVATEPEQSLFWRANHTDETLPVTGGAAQVRMLTGAIDGDSWPFTVVTTVKGERWFQVLGTADSCILELGDLTTVTMVARRTDTPRTLVQLPPGCQYWVTSAAPSELFTAEVAAHLGTRHLRGYEVPYGFELRPVHWRPNSRRP